MSSEHLDINQDTKNNLPETTPEDYFFALDSLDDFDNTETIISGIVDYLNKSTSYQLNAINNNDLAVSKTSEALEGIDEISIIKNGEIKDGILILTLKDGSIHFTNLIHPEGKFKTQLEIKNFLEYKQLQEKDDLVSQTVFDVKEYMDALDRESLMGGGIVVSYGLVLGTNNFFIESLYINKQGGGRELLKFESGKSNVGTKVELKSCVFQLLKEKGIEYNYKTNEFFKISEVEISIELKTEIDKLNYKQYKDIAEKNGETILSKEEFKNSKTSIINELKGKELKISNLKNIQKILFKYGLGSAAQHVLFLPVFFQAFHKNSSDLASSMKSLSEMGLFYSGMSLGAKVSKNPYIAGGVGLIAGIASVAVGEKIGETLGIDKKFWKAYPEREDFWEKKGWEGKSFITHAITAGTVNDLMDNIGVDFGIPLTQLTFVQTKVDLNTSPRDYLSSGVRNIDFWNQRIDRFGNETTNKIYKLSQNYKNESDDSIFSWSDFGDLSTFSEDVIDIASFGSLKSPVDTNIDVKNNRKNLILKDEIESIIDYGMGEYGGNQEVKNKLMISIYNLITQSPNKVKSENISFIVHNTIKNIKIDNNFYQKEQELLDSQRLQIEIYTGSEIEGIPKEYIDIISQSSPLNELNKEEINFAKKIYQRIINHDRMLDQDIDLGYNSVKTGENQYFKTQGKIGLSRLIQKSQDRIYFEKLIENDNFVQFLNTVVEYKRQKDFIKNIQDTGYPVKWQL